jgi:hypothetical protein
VGIGERFDWFHGVDMEDTLHLNLNSAVHACRGSSAASHHTIRATGEYGTELPSIPLEEAILNSSLDRPLHVVSYEFRSRLDFIISLVQYRVEMAMPVARELLLCFVGRRKQTG